MAPELELQFELHSIFGGSGDVDLENQGSIDRGYAPFIDLQA